MVDRNGRNIDYMRISVTDRCNLRCIYCMPKEGVEGIPHEEVLSYEEMLRVVKAAAALGIRKIKVTGGEPLVRKGIVSFIRRIKNIDGIDEVTMTTNGVLFPKYGQALAEAGLSAVNFSLDCLDAESFCRITRFDAISHVKDAIELALKLGIKTKINCVPIDQYNSDDLVALAGLAKEKPIDVRFIELMPIGLGRDYSPVSRETVLEKLVKAYGLPMKSTAVHGNGPAVYYDFPGFKAGIGFISAISHEFCETCNRVRMTADGKLKLCLCFNNGIELKPLLRGGASDEDLKDALFNAIYEKPAHHNFNEKMEESNDLRKMVQIGG